MGPLSLESAQVLPWHTPLFSAHGRGYYKTRFDCQATRICSHQKWEQLGPVCLLSQEVFIEHLLGAGTGQDSGTRRGNGNTGVWWLRCGLCYVFPKFQAQLIRWGGGGMTIFFSPVDLSHQHQTYHVLCLFKKNFYWSLVVLQCCVSLHCTTEWISHTHTDIPSLLDFPPI